MSFQTGNEPYSKALQTITNQFLCFIFFRGMYEHLISCIPSHQEAIDVGLLDQLSLDKPSRNKVITLPETKPKCAWK